MYYDGNFLHQQLRITWPLVQRVTPLSGPTAQVSALKFWITGGDVNHHLAVIHASDMQHIHHTYAQTIFVVVGGPLKGSRNIKNECFVLPDEVSVEEAFNRLLEIQSLFDTWQEHLRLGFEHMSFVEMINACDPLISHPLALTDEQFNYVGYSSDLAHDNGFEARYVDPHGYLPLPLISQWVSDPEYPQLKSEKGTYVSFGEENIIKKNVFWNGEYVGRLNIPYTGDEVQDAYYRGILTSVCQYVERLYAKSGTFWHSKTANQGVQKTLESLLAGHLPNDQDLRTARMALGCQLGDQLELVQLRPRVSADHSRLDQVLATQLETAWPASVALSNEGHFLLLVNLSGYERQTRRLFAQDFAVFLRESLIMAGGSRVFEKIVDLQAAYQQTNIAFEQGEEKDPMRWYYRFDEYALKHMLRQARCGLTWEQVGSPAVVALMHYDSSHGTELSRTLETYINCRYNALSTAQELCIARSTLVKRFARIEEVSGLDVTNADQRLYAQLTYRIMHA